MGTIRFLNRMFVSIIRYVCVTLLILMTGFTVYTVIMRYVFLNPPFWGDTLAVFANIWFVLLAFALAVYDREHIAMQGLYDVVPRGLAFLFRLLWDFLILGMGVFLVVYGIDIMEHIRGRYYELGGLSKGVPMMILPISGGLVVIGVLSPIVHDLRILITQGLPRKQVGDHEAMVADEALAQRQTDVER